MPKIQIRVARATPEAPWVIEAQSINGNRHRLTAEYADHADLVVEVLKAGARLAGLTNLDIATFLPEDWVDQVERARRAQTPPQPPDDPDDRSAFSRRMQRGRH